MAIGERIRELRERRNMNQQELAEAVGYKTASAVNKIEMGLRDVKQNKIQAFADALGVKPSDLLNDESVLSDNEGNRIELVQDELFEKRKLLFDLSNKASAEDLDKFITILETIIK